MINTSQTFYNNSTYKYRDTACKIIVDVVDLTAKEDIDSCIANEYKYFNSSQTYNEITEAPKWATGELNEFKLDGSMTLLPNVRTDEEIGFWTKLSDEYGNFTTNPTLTYTLENLHESIGITVFYDEFSYPIKSRCHWYNGSTLLKTMVIDNQDTNIQLFECPVTNYNKIVIEILKAKPYAFAKIIETNFGITKNFDGNKIMDASVTEEISTMSNSIYPKKLEFTIEDFDLVYDFFNPEDLMRYFKSGQPCKAYSGVLDYDTNTYEYIPMGTFYIDKTSMENLRLKIESYGILNKLNNIEYYSKIFNNNTVEYIVGDILGSDIDYYIHDNVKSKTLSGYIPHCSKKEAIKNVCISIGAICKEDRYGTLCIYRPTEELSHNQIITEDTVYDGNSEAPLMVAGITPIYTQLKPHPNIITIDRNCRLSSLYPSMIGFYKQMDVYCNKYTLESTAEELFNDTIITDSNGISIIEIGLSNNVTVSGISNYTIYADTVIVSGTPNTSYNVVINGKKYETTTSIVSVVSSKPNVYDEEILTLILDSSNSLITDTNNAIEIGTWYLSLLEKRNDVEFDWWSVATVEAGDTVKLETSYDEMKNAMITSIEYDLCGLVAKVKGVC